MQTIENKILARIYGHGRGWAFTKIDFASEFGPDIRVTLSNLVKKDKIRRVTRGVYDYPRYSELLDTTLSPDIDQVARAIARRYNWRILPSGDAALNLLGLSTQVPAKWVYLSDGPSRQYEIENQKLDFVKIGLNQMGFKYRKSGLVVQAIKALGKDHVGESTIEKIRQQLDNKERTRLVRDTRTVPAWIHQIIKEVSRESD